MLATNKRVKIILKICQNENRCEGVENTFLKITLSDVVVLTHFVPSKPTNWKATEKLGKTFMENSF